MIRAQHWTRRFLGKDCCSSGGSEADGGGCDGGWRVVAQVQQYSMVTALGGERQGGSGRKRRDRMILVECGEDEEFRSGFKASQHL